jgi:hypothetical protein
MRPLHHPFLTKTRGTVRSLITGCRSHGGSGSAYPVRCELGDLGCTRPDSRSDGQKVEGDTEHQVDGEQLNALHPV